MAKMLRHGLATVGLLVLTVLGALYAYTFTDHFREFARREVLELLRGSFRGELAMERLEGSVWGDMRLVGVSLRHGSVDVLYVPAIKLRYALLPLLHGELRITDIDLDAPVADLRRDEQGEWNLATALSTPPGASSTSSAPRLVIDALRVAAGKISVTPCRGQAPCLLEDVALGARIGIETAGVDVDVERLSLRAAAEGLPLLWADGSGRYRGVESPPWAEIRYFTVATQQSRATLRGKVENVVSLRDAKSDLSMKIDGLGPADVSIVAPGSAPADWLGGSVRLLGPANDLRAHFELAAGQGTARGDLHADVLTTPIAADGTIEVHDLELARVASAAEVGGVANGRLEGAVRGTNLLLVTATGSLAVRDASFRQWRFGDLTATATLAKGRVSTEGALRDGASATAHWNGFVELGGTQAFQLAMSLSHIDPKRLDARAPGGDVTLEARTEGRGFELAGQRSRTIVELAPSRLESLTIDRGRAELRLAEGRLNVDELSLTSHDSLVRVAGGMGLSAGSSGQATVEARIADVSPFLALSGREGRGSVALNATLRGNTSNLAASGSLKAASLGISDSWLERGTVTFDLKGVGGRAPEGLIEASFGGIHSALTLESADARVTLSGVGSAIAADADVKAADLGGRHHTASFRASHEPSGLDVRLAAVHLEAPGGNFDLEHPAHLALRSGVVTVDDLRISGSKGALAASGRVSRSGPQRFDLTMRGVPLEWLRSFGRNTGEIAGVVAAKLDVAGTAESPELAATLSVTDLRVAGRPYAGLKATAGYRAPTATVEARLDQDASHALIASGRAPLDLRWDPDLVHRIAGDIDLALRSSGLDVAFVNALFPQSLRNVAGEIVVDVEAHGPLEQPAPRGTVALRGGRATISALGVDLNAVNLALSIAPDAIRVTELSAASHDGRLSGGGTISMAGYAPDRLDLRFALDRWPAIATNRHRSDVSAEISCQGTVGAPQITGTFDVLWGLFRPNLDFLVRAPAKRDPTIRIVSAGVPAAGTPAPPPPATASSEPSALYKNTMLDVTVTVHRNTWITHADAAVELTGSVVARKQSGADLQLTGDIEAVRGWMNFQGRRFQIAEGDLAFTGGPKIDPSIDVTAEYKTSDYVVHVILGGTSSAPSLKLTSEPSLSQADILSVLMFGKTSKELNEGQRDDMQNRAAQLATAYAASEIGQSVNDALGLSGRGIQLQELSASRVALGTYLTDRTFVTVGQTLGAQQGQEVRVEYELTPRWSVTSSAASAGGSGADIIWRRRY
jgi:translocation and assembly module TamB